MIPTPVGPVMLTGEFIRHLVEKRPQQRERFAELIVPTLRDPVEVWLQPTIRRDGRLSYESAYIGDHGAFVVAQEHREGTIGWTFYLERRLRRRRRGYLLYRREGV